nr:unnamed protein product [Callosobruchus analis]
MGIFYRSRSGVTNFNGQHGCLKCTTVGEYSYITHCNIFPRIQCPKRTDYGFRSRQYPSHHKCYTPLENLQVNMVDDFPVADSLHLIDLGVMKRCLMGWRDGSFRSFRVKWSATDTKNISEFLLSCKLPLEIHRSVRGLDCLSQWKGLEYRTFFYYIGIVVLKDYLPYDVYEHFLVLFCAITICSSKFYSQYISLADQMLLHYIEKYKDIYGEDYITSNVHNLSHLSDDVKRFGILSSFSSYPFESKLFQIKNLLRNTRNPLIQAAKRLSESDNNVHVDSKKKFPFLKKQNDGEGIVIEVNIRTKFFYHIEVTEGLTLNTEFRNKWFLTNDNEIVSFKKVIAEDEEYFIWGSSLKHIYNFFQTPIQSSYLNIYISDCEENIAKLYSLNNIKCKLVCIRKEKDRFIFPFLRLVEGSSPVILTVRENDVRLLTNANIANTNHEKIMQQADTSQMTLDAEVASPDMFIPEESSSICSNSTSTTNIENSVSSTGCHDAYVPISTVKSLKNDLAVWAVNHKIPQVALTSLLQTLKEHFPSEVSELLPNDARCVLKTPRATVVQSIEPGQHFHIGIKYGIEKFLGSRVKKYRITNQYRWSSSFRV